MSRKIKLTEEDINILLETLKKDLINSRYDAEKVTLTADTELKEVEKVKVCFTTEAYCKMKTLVANSAKEIAWHGIVERPEPDKYVIKDILVYPQEVSGATVTSNDAKYPIWLMQLPDETFNHLRFQGHSHVNFGATPSGVDLTLYDNMLQTLNENDFYIFFIMNKKEDFWIQVYDLEKNIIYTEKDIDLSIVFNDGTAAIEWYGAQCRDMIIEPTPIINTTNSKSKILDPTWKWDVSRNCHVPSRATKKEITNCFKKAKANSGSEKEYKANAEKELELLHDELEELAELDGRKNAGDKLEGNELEYWRKFVRGGYLDD